MPSELASCGTCHEWCKSQGLGCTEKMKVRMLRKGVSFEGDEQEVITWLLREIGEDLDETLV